MSRTIFHLDLDAFFVAVERRLDPTLNGKPVIVSPGAARSVVAAVSYEARRFGVHSAMPYAQAKRLCPQAVVLPGNFHAYQKASRAFFKILGTYSPRLEPVSLDEGYLDFTGCERLFGPALPAATGIQARVKRDLGLDVSIGIAGSKTTAKMASDLAKPAGILQVLPGCEAALLAPLPIGRLLGVGPKSEERLRAFGIRVIGDLAKLSPALLARAFGQPGVWLRELARGEDDSPVCARGPAKSMGNEETFAVDTTDPDFLLQALQRLISEVGFRLRRHGQVARTACVKVRYADFSLHTCSRPLSPPTALDTELYAAGKKLLEQVLTRRVRIRLLGFTAQNLMNGQEQLDWVDERGHNKRLALHQAMDRLRRRHGYDVLGWAAERRVRVEK